MTRGKSLAIIPARGGSKGVVRKNLRMVGNKPLIQWTIDAAKDSTLKEDLWVTTDDEEIEEVAKSLGVRTIPRPKNLAGDKTPMQEVVRHSMDFASKYVDDNFEFFVLLQPTAPARSTLDIDESIKQLSSSGADSLVSVYMVEDAHPSRMYRLADENSLEPYAPEPAGSLRQDLEPLYHRNGAIYACRTDFFRATGKLWGGKIAPYLMPRERSINIDDELDLTIADCLLSLQKHQQ